MKSYGMADMSFDNTRKGFSAMTQDAITVLNDVPFSIPPYFALLGRALITLEGIALTGNEDYGLIMEAYPFVARKLLSDDRPEIQKALFDVLYSGDGLRTSRVSALLNSAMGYVAKSGAFVDLDALPDEEASFAETLRFALGEETESIRGILLDEIESAADVLLRQAARKAQTGVFNVPLLGSFLSSTASLSLPILVPTANGPRLIVANSQKVLDTLAPKLTRDEELFALSLVDIVKEVAGDDAAVVLSGDSILEPTAAARFLFAAAASGADGAGNATASQAAESILQSLGGEKLGADLGSAWSQLSPAEQATGSEAGTKLLEGLQARLSKRLESLAGAR